MKVLKKRRSIADTQFPGGVVQWRALMATRSAELKEFNAEMERRSLSPGTIGKRMGVLVRCEVALGHPLLDATHLELRDWLDGLKLQAKTRYGYISHFSAFWTWALIDERVTKNPTLRLTRPKFSPGLPRPVSTDDLAMMIGQAPNAEMRAMITLGGHVGLRCMEIAGLGGADVMEHLHPPVIVVARGKGGKARVIPISPGTVETLRAHGIPAHGPLFTDHEGVALTPWQVSHLLRNHMHACGVNASAHQLRHTFGTEMYRRSNNDLRMTQELLGHASPSTTAIYTAWSNDRAAAVVDTLFT